MTLSGIYHFTVNKPTDNKLNLAAHQAEKINKATG